MMEFILNWYGVIIGGMGAIILIIIIVEAKNCPTIDMPDNASWAASHDMTIDDIQDVIRDLRDTTPCDADSTMGPCTCNKYDLVLDEIDGLRLMPNKQPEQGCSFDEDLYPNGRDFDEAVAKDEDDFNAPISRSALDEIGNFGQFAEDRNEVQPSDFPENG